MAALLLILAAIAVAVAALWFVGSREPVFSIKAETRLWFVAIKTNKALPRDCAPSVQVLWSVCSDFALIGAQEPYWTHFMVVASAAPPPLVNSTSVQDAYVARLRLLTPSRMALGVLKALVWTGVLSRPRSNGVPDAGALGFRPELLPTERSVAALLAKPADYAPVMVNFLEYADPTPSGESGRTAYRRYGQVALRTVYSTGGALVFFARVEEVVRVPKAGPTLGRWSELAAMRYPNPQAILSMEAVPAYRDALKHRDAGLARTVVIATHPC